MFAVVAVPLFNPLQVTFVPSRPPVKLEDKGKRVNSAPRFPPARAGAGQGLEKGKNLTLYVPIPTAKILKLLVADASDPAALIDQAPPKPSISNCQQKVEGVVSCILSVVVVSATVPDWQLIGAVTANPE